jgi:DNA-binding transcriptional LysR family regulator
LKKWLNWLPNCASGATQNWCAITPVARVYSPSSKPTSRSRQPAMNNSGSTISMAITSGAARPGSGRPEWTTPATPISAIYPARRHLSPKVRAFISRAGGVFAAHPSLHLHR